MTNKDIFKAVIAAVLADLINGRILVLEDHEIYILGNLKH